MQGQDVLACLHDRRHGQLLGRLERIALAGPGLVPVQNEDAAFVFFARVADLDVQQEPVELRFGQRVRALLFDRVLSRHDHEQIVECVTAVADGDLPLLHRLQQRGLHLGRRAVDLVRENQVVKQRPFTKLEGTFLRPVDIGAGQVRWQQIRRELQAMKVTLDTLGQNLDRPGLGQARCALDQQMAIAQQRDQHPVDEVRLPNDETACMGLKLLKFLDDAHQLLRTKKSA